VGEINNECSKDFENYVFTVNSILIDINWYLDSSATTHVMGNPQNFKALMQTTKLQNVKSIAGHSHLVCKKGNIVVSNNGDAKYIHDVFYVPNIT
jgi:hypothetical protein